MRDISLIVTIHMLVSSRETIGVGQIRGGPLSDCMALVSRGPTSCSSHSHSFKGRFSWRCHEQVMATLAERLFTHGYRHMTKEKISTDR
jgi:hypothetical protein